MPKDARYHEAAIRYNEEIAAFAENLAPTLEDEEIQRWARAVAKQHRFHAGRHKKALNKLQEEDASEDISPAPMSDDVDPVGVNPDMLESDVETAAEQDAQIDKLHGPGAAEVIEKAYADGSIFSEQNEEQNNG